MIPSIEKATFLLIGTNILSVALYVKHIMRHTHAYLNIYCIRT